MSVTLTILPRFFEQRRAACKACERATRTRFRGVDQVTLQDRCAPDGPQLVAILGDPDYACPMGRFGRALLAPGESMGVPITKDGAIVGFRPLKFRSVSKVSKPTPPRVSARKHTQMRAPKTKAPCGSCGGGERGLTIEEALRESEGLA